MTKLTGILAVAGTSLVGVAFVLVAMHFRDSAEVPRWTPPSASLAPVMMGFAEPPPSQVAPRTVAAPIIAPTPIPAPAPVVAVAPQPPPPPVAMLPPPPPTTIPVAEPAPAPDPDEDDDVSQAQAEQVAAMKVNKLRALDLRSKRMMNHPRINANLVNPAAVPELR